ncbi:ferredoxin III, nif-specific [Aromatoleum toluvorans]|uniref:Ferredoxin III, nif-specific n=1 Tax=Aromatoleum toluvorans TaxID=92002 RepID=A0ABX1PU68_9RHOO|nr:ferredoxin III, nif-specific [Aromatoleum toluvorans]NMG42898.1 ferredoxin III, nif-specific [Aromatoleum toluvorans]
MSHYTVKLPSGVIWTPRFIAAINQEKCIGCGRCFKTCAREVLQLMAMDDDGELVAIDADDDEEYEKKVMSIAQPENCVGCESCNNNCARRCISYAPAAA